MTPTVCVDDAAHHDDALAVDLYNTMDTLVDEFLERDLSPPVEAPADINNGFCLYFAVTAYDRLEETTDVSLLQHGTMGANHVWIEYNGYHFDAEAPRGVKHLENLPFVERFSNMTVGTPTVRERDFFDIPGDDF